MVNEACLSDCLTFGSYCTAAGGWGRGGQFLSFVTVPVPSRKTEKSSQLLVLVFMKFPNNL